MTEPRDFEKDIKKVIQEHTSKMQTLEQETNALLEKAKEDFSIQFQRKTKEDFLEQNKKEKKLKLKKSEKMKKLFFILFVIIGVIFVYFKFIRTNETKAIEYSLTTTSIAKIIADPRDYENKEVSVHGTVETSFNLGVKYYVLNDGTGTIYVIAEKAVPKVGEVVKVTGKFNQRLKIGNLQVETITEK